MKETKSLGRMQIAIIALTLLTALIHLALAFPSFGDYPVFAVLFLLNGIGYLALVAGLYFVPALAARRPLIRWALIGFTAVTIVAYLALNVGEYSALGLADKAIEAVLILLLLRDRW
jgi:hypothetical protein